ncbi:MAG: hypothetical protein HYY06_21590 [Deltaproteobacteria bacterium]|nr:hypothetical protein [Deltaproteobacteria bacterium]
MERTSLAVEWKAERSDLLRFAALAVLGAALCTAACGDDDDDDGADVDAGVVTDAGEPDSAVDPGPTRVVFEPGEGVPSWGEVPFPSDLYRDADGTLSRIPGLEGAIRSNSEVFQVALDELDGFGLTPSIVFFLDPLPPEPIELPEDAVIVLDPDGTRVPLVTFYDEQRGWILAGPATGTVLAEGATYVAALTTAVPDLVPDAAMRPLLEAERPTGLEAYADAVDLVAPAAGGRENLLAVTAFTTQRVTHELALAREALGELPRPVPSFDEEGTAPFGAMIFTRTSDPSLDDWLGETGKDDEGNDLPAFADGVSHDALALVATGAFDAVTFRRPDTGDDGPEDETFEIGPDGRPAAQGTERIPFSITIPAGPPPSEAGFPVMIVQHGLNGDRSYIMAFANTAARHGVATVAIEAVSHGSRWRHVDEVSSFAGEYAGPDGFDDPGGLAVLEFFEQFTNLLGARDSFRQSSLDHAQLALMMTDPELDLGALGEALDGEAPRIDGSRVYYVGDSLGGILGTITTSIEPTISLSILNVPGAGIVQRLLPKAPRAVELVELLVDALFGVTGREMYMPASPEMALMQAILDGGDPQAYAPHLFHDRLEVAGAPIPPRDVVLIEVDRDELVSNESTDHLALAAGIAELDPWLYAIPGLAPVEAPVSANLETDPWPVTGLLVQVGPAIHGSDIVRFEDFRYYFPEADDLANPFEPLPEPIPVRCPVVELHEMVGHILETKLDGPAEVLLPLTPMVDFDGDGVSDDDEIAAGTDPWGG